MANLLKTASEAVAKDIVSEQPAQEASGLTIEDVAELGFDHELIQFAVFHTGGSIWKAVEALLKFEKRPDKGSASGLLDFAFWVAERDRFKALKLLARFRSGTPAQSKMSRSTAPEESTERSNANAAQKDSSLERPMNESENQSKTVVPTVATKPIIAKTTNSSQSESKAAAATIKKEPTVEPIISKPTPTRARDNASGSGTKRKFEVIDISDDESIDINAHNSSRVKHDSNTAVEDSVAEDSAAEDSAAEDSPAEGIPADDHTPEDPLPLVNKGVWADKKIAWAEKMFQRSKSRIVLHRSEYTSSDTHKADCFVRVFQRASSLAAIRKSLLQLESQAYPYLTQCILEGAKASATIELKDACSRCSVTHKWMLNLDEVVVLLISNHPPSKSSLLALETKIITNNRHFTTRKLCGNDACRRPSHVIGESREAARARGSCQNARKSILERGDFPPDKCVMTEQFGHSGKHFPACLRDLTLSDEASYDACVAHNWRNWRERPVIKVAFGQKVKKTQKLKKRKVVST